MPRNLYYSLTKNKVILPTIKKGHLHPFEDAFYECTDTGFVRFQSLQKIVDGVTATILLSSVC
jgi:hypothetical protein